jgi:mannose/fructose/N-acetylgalactosamine-specific phosphotransferase system component IID
VVRGMSDESMVGACLLSDSIIHSVKVTLFQPLDDAFENLIDRFIFTAIGYVLAAEKGNITNPLTQFQSKITNTNIQGLNNTSKQHIQV